MHVKGEGKQAGQGEDFTNREAEVLLLRHRLCVTVVLIMAVALACPAALANEKLKVFADFGQLPEGAIGDFTVQFNEDLPALQDVELTEQPFLADVFLLATGAPITAGESVIGYSLAVTLLGVRGCDDKGVILFMYPSVIPLVVGPSQVDWAARQAVLELNAYLDWLVEVGELQVAEK